MWEDEKMPGIDFEGFESTYKELKSELWPQPFGSALRFESTYKELKFVGRIWNMAEQRSFESTYKELKSWNHYFA